MYFGISREVKSKCASLLLFGVPKRKYAKPSYPSVRWKTVLKERRLGRGIFSTSLNARSEITLGSCVKHYRDEAFYLQMYFFERFSFLSCIRLEVSSLVELEHVCHDSFVSIPFVGTTTPA